MPSLRWAQNHLTFICFHGPHAYAYHILELSETVAGRGISQAPEEVLIKSEALDSNPTMKSPVMGNTLGDPQVWSPREVENTIKHDKTYLDNPLKAWLFNRNQIQVRNSKG